MAFLYRVSIERRSNPWKVAVYFRPFAANIKYPAVLWESDHSKDKALQAPAYAAGVLLFIEGLQAFESSFNCSS